MTRIACPTVAGAALLFAHLLFPNAAISAEPESVLWGDLSAGQYDVGFRIERYSRVPGEGASTGPGRPLKTMIWYPTYLKNGHGRPFRFRDYVQLATGIEEGNTQPEFQAWLSMSVTGKADGIDEATSGRILDSPMTAVPDAPVLAERFPLALWTMRHDTAVAQSVLSEYLASHGYAVAYTVFDGPRLPFPWEMATAEEKQRVFSLQMSDLESSLQYVSRQPDVDGSLVGIINWSYAAEFSPRLQVKSPAVDIVLGLSSNPLSEWGLYQGEGAAAVLSPEKLDVPYVIMTERLGPDGKVRAPPKILSRLPKTSYFVSFDGLAHGNFNVLEGMLPGVFGIAQVQSWSKGGATAKRGYEAIARQTRYFLDSVLKQNGSTAGSEYSFVTVTRFGG